MCLLQNLPGLPSFPGLSPAPHLSHPPTLSSLQTLPQATAKGCNFPAPHTSGLAPAALSAGEKPSHPPEPGSGNIFFLEGFSIPKS